MCFKLCHTRWRSPGFFVFQISMWDPTTPGILCFRQATERHVLQTISSLRSNHPEASRDRSENRFVQKRIFKFQKCFQLLFQSYVCLMWFRLYITLKKSQIFISWLVWIFMLEYASSLYQNQFLSISDGRNLDGSPSSRWLIISTPWSTVTWSFTSKMAAPLIASSDLSWL